MNTTMKRLLLAAAVGAMATMGIARADDTNKPAEAAKPPGPPPKIQFDKTVYDFGPTSFVDSVTGTFTFQNTGTGDLKVGKPQPSCGCTVASVKPDLLKQGEKGELVFKVNIGAAHGPIEKHITVPSNDPQTPSISLSIKADVRQVVQVSPSQVQVGAIRPGMITNVTVTVARTDGQKLVIINTQPSSKQVRTSVEPVEGSTNQSAKLTITIEGEGRPRILNDNVKVFIEGVTPPVATVMIVGQLLGDVSVSPEQLYWPITDPSKVPPANVEAQSIRRVAVASTRPEQCLEIKNLSSSLKDLSVEVVTVQTCKTFSVVAKFAETPKESERGTISFETNTPTQPKITIPVTITVLK
jgi:hypothetical protein